MLVVSRGSQSHDGRRLIAVAIAVAESLSLSLVPILTTGLPVFLALIFRQSFSSLAPPTTPAPCLRRTSLPLCRFLVKEEKDRRRESE